MVPAPEKSVLLRSIVGLHNPDAGDIQLFSEQLNTLSAERRSQLEQRILFQQALFICQLGKYRPAAD